MGASLSFSALTPIQQQLVIALTIVFVTTIVVIYMMAQRPPGEDDESSDDDEPGAKKTEIKKFLNRERQKAPLKAIVTLSHNTKLFRFTLPKEHCLGLPCGKHIKVFGLNPNPGGKTMWNAREDVETAEEIERKYTPTSSDEVVGHFDLLVKVYHANDKFSHGGKMSQLLNGMKVGEQLEFSGPWGVIEYLGKGKVKKLNKEFYVKKIGMIAGGTGITPMLQIIEAILFDDADDTQISLIFANQTEDDILLRRRLEEIAEEEPARFRLHFTLDYPPSNWQQSEGFVTKEMIQAHLAAPGDDCLILMCGPPPMIKYACKPNLQALGYPADRQLEF